ncbi:MAG TPA: hypothetical protein VI653_16755 [Steroidobacteraceae bacterium]
MSAPGWQYDVTSLASCARDIENSPVHWISSDISTRRGTTDKHGAGSLRS